VQITEHIEAKLLQPI